HDEDLNTFVFDTKGDSKPLPAPRKLIGVAADGRTAVVPVQEEGPGSMQTHEIKPDGTVEPRKVEDQIVEGGAQALPATTKMIVPGGVPDPRNEAGDGQLLRVSRIAFSPDGSVVALVAWDGAVHLFRTANGEELCAPLRHGIGKGADAIRSVTFCPVGDTL